MELIGRDLACIRGGREVFSGLEFRVDAGRALLLFGPNGSGKSSLLRLVAGLLRPAAGTIALQGGEAELSIAEQAHYLGHQDALKPSLSVRENLEFWADFLGGGAGAEASGKGRPGRGSFTKPPPERGRSANACSPGGGHSSENHQECRPEHDSTTAPVETSASDRAPGGGHSVPGRIEGAENQPGLGPAMPPPEMGRSAGRNSPGGGQTGADAPVFTPRPDLPPSRDGETDHSTDSIDAALSAVGLDELADLPAAYLSAGQRRRLSIARLLAVPRPLWLLDEPTAALDASAQARLIALMHAHLAGGGLLLAATHGPLGLDAAQELRLGGTG